VFIRDEWHDAAVHDESALTGQGRFDGPAIIELPDTTIVVGIDQVATVDAHSNVILEAAAQAGEAGEQ
jgi:N-methylhydantoinase A